MCSPNTFSFVTIARVTYRGGDNDETQGEYIIVICTVAGSIWARHTRTRSVRVRVYKNVFLCVLTNPCLSDMLLVSFSL